MPNLTTPKPGPKQQLPVKPQTSESMMEAATIFAFIGAVIAGAFLGLWAGVSMVTGLPMPTSPQAQGMMLMGFFGLPLALGAVMLVMSVVEHR